MKYASGSALMKWAPLYLLLFSGCTEITWHSPPPPSTLGEATYGILYSNLERSPECRQEYLAPLIEDKALFIHSVDTILPPETLSSLPSFLNEGMSPLAAQHDLPAIGEVVAAWLAPLTDDQNDPELLTLTSILRLAQTRSVLQPKHFFLLVERLLNDPKIKEALHSAASLALEHNGEDHAVNEVLHLLSYHLSGAADGFQCERLPTLDLERTLLRDDLIGSSTLNTDPAWLVRSDKHGNPRVMRNQQDELPPPFIDTDHDGAADVNAGGQPVDHRGDVIVILPFDTTGPRDADGRALTQNDELLYDYYDTKQTGLTLLLLLAHNAVQAQLHHPLTTLIDGVLGPQQGCSEDTRTCQAYSPSDHPIADGVHLGLEVAKYDAARVLLTTWSQLLNNNPELAEDTFISLGNILQSLQEADAEINPNQMMSLLLDALPLFSEVFETPNDSSESTGRLLMGVIHELGKTARHLPDQILTTLEYHTLHKEVACSDAPPDLRRSVPVDYSRPRYFLDDQSTLIDNRSSLEQSIELLRNVDCGSVPFTGGTTLAHYVIEYAASMDPDDTCNLIDSLLGWLGVFPSMGETLSVATLNLIGCDGELVWGDLQSLDSLAKSGALDSYLPIARVFVEREQVGTLLSIFHLLADDLQQAPTPGSTPSIIRSSLPLLGDIIKSGALDQLFDLDELLVTVEASDNSGTAADVLVDSVERLLREEPRVETRLGPRENTSLAREVLLSMQAFLRRVQESNSSEALQTVTTHMTSYITETEVNDNGTSFVWDDRVELKHPYILPLVQMSLDFFVALLDVSDESRHCYLNQMQTASNRYFTSDHFGSLVRLLHTLRTSPHAPPLEALLERSLNPTPDSDHGDILGPLVQILSGLLQASPDDVDMDRFVRYLSGVFDPTQFDGRSALLTLDTLLENDPDDFLLSLGRNALLQGPSGAQNAPIANLATTLGNIATVSPQNMCLDRIGPWTAPEVAPLIDRTINFLTAPDSGLNAISEFLRTRSHSSR